MEDLGERVGRKPACAVGSDLPSGTAPPADSTPRFFSFIFTKRHGVTLAVEGCAFDGDPRAADRDGLRVALGRVAAPADVGEQGCRVRDVRHLADVRDGGAGERAARDEHVAVAVAARGSEDQATYATGKVRLIGDGRWSRARRPCPNG